MRGDANLGFTFIECSWLHITKSKIMNKVIFTDDRVFMPIVGPSGCGKTQLIFEMLQNNTFQPAFERIYFFYQQYQELYKEMQMKLRTNIEFVPCINFAMINTLKNCLLIFDDSCEEIYEDRNFLKIAVSGRHRKLHVIFVKHNLFHQSKQSRTIDLSTTHLILFNSPRDVNQINYLGKQLKKTEFLSDAFEKSIAEPFGHLLIDLDSKTSPGLRFCSNIVQPGATIFYIPSSKAVITPLTNERERIGYTTALATA